MENVRIPEKWNEWTDLEKIGEGSYGTVYKASRMIGGEMVYCAIKVIHVPKEEQEMQEMLQLLGKKDALKEYYRDLVNDYIREIQAMERLKGITNIVSIQDYALEPNDDGYGWTIFIQMEFLTPFQTYMISHPINELEVIQLGIDLCNALIYCEKAGIVHKDLKVENIFVSDMGNYELGDFGVARKMDRTTSTYSSRGTFSYMAPEIFKGEPYDHRADIYSLGLVMYRLLNNNREPFLPADKQMIFFRDREDALVKRMGGDPIPPPAEASNELSDIILKSLSYDKEDRYSSALEMKTALESIAKKREPEKQPVSSASKKNPLVFAVPGIAFLVLAALLFVFSQKKPLHTESTETSLSADRAAIPLDTESERLTETEVLHDISDQKDIILIDVSAFAGVNISNDGKTARKWVNKKKLSNALLNAGVAEDAIGNLIEDFIDQFKKKDGSTSIQYQPTPAYLELLEKSGVSFLYSPEDDD